MTDNKTELGLKLDKIASLIADEVIRDNDVLPLTEKCAVLKTLDAHYAVVHKIEPTDNSGGAFDKYRNKVAAASGGGAGNPGDASGTRRSLATVDFKPRSDSSESSEDDN
jgi:hypothetical protein